MTWNYRIMRRYQPESPETYWYEIVEVYYGDDGIPMMWGTGHMPIIADLDIELLEQEEEDIDLEDFVKEGLLEQFTQLMRDVDSRGPILDERDFENGGVYADHRDAVKLRQVAEELGTDELVARIREKLKDEEDDDEDEQL